MMHACEITDNNGKLHYTGAGSGVESYAIAQGYKTRIITLTGHCIPTTANGFIHTGKDILKNDPVKINDELPDKNLVATEEEHKMFIRQICDFQHSLL